MDGAPDGGTPAPDLVVVGSASRDLADDDPRGWRLGGGVTYAALAAARLGLRTAALIGVDAEAAGASELDLLRAAGVEVLAERLDHAPVFHNLETPAGRIQTCRDPGTPLRARPLPGSWRQAIAWFLAPVADEIGDEWASEVPPAAALIVGWQGLLRDLAAGERVRRRPPTPSALVARADLVAISRHDVAADLPDDALLALLRPGATLVITHGAEGGRALTVGEGRSAEAHLAYAPIRSDEEVDATGAGDTFLAALVTALIERASLELPGSGGAGAAGPGRSALPVPGLDDLAFAAAAASLAVEGPGLTAVPSRVAVQARLRTSR